MNKAAQAYFQTKVNTTDQGQLLLLLYDGALRFLAQAREKMQAKDFAAKGILISKVIDILNELTNTLNLEKGGTLAENLNNLYFLCITRLLQANLKMNVDQLDSVVTILSGLRSAYAEIIETPEAKKASAQISARLNVDASITQRAAVTMQNNNVAPTSFGRMQARNAYGAQKPMSPAGAGMAVPPSGIPAVGAEAAQAVTQAPAQPSAQAPAQPSAQASAQQTAASASMPTQAAVQTARQSSMQPSAQAAGQATAKAHTQASAQAAGQTTEQATEQATGQATGQAGGQAIPPMAPSPAQTNVQAPPAQSPAVAHTAQGQQTSGGMPQQQSAQEQVAMSNAQAPSTQPAVAKPTPTPASTAPTAASTATTAATAAASSQKAAPTPKAPLAPKQGFGVSGFAYTKAFGK